MRWNASYIAWSKYIHDLRLKYSDKEIEPRKQRNSGNEVLLISETTNPKGVSIESVKSPDSRLNVNEPCRSLAVELVDEFTKRVVYLTVQNERLNALVHELKTRLDKETYGNNSVLADRVITALDVINGVKRC